FLNFPRKQRSPPKRAFFARHTRRAVFWCPRGDSNPYDSRRYHLKVVRLPIPPPGLKLSRRLRRAAHCTRYSAGVAASCAFSCCAGAGTSLAAGAAAGTSEAAGGGGSSPGATDGAAGTSSWPITPRSWSTTGRAPWVAYQAMNRLMPKNTTASHLVLLDRKLDAPRAPNTVPEAPAPKPEPAAAPAPRCSRISTIMAIATSTYTTLRISISIVRVSLTGPPQRPGQWPGNPRPPGRR